MLKQIKHYVDNENWMEAVELLDEVMSREPMNPMALFLFGQVMLATGKQSVAYPLYKLLTQLEPKRPEIWINMGKAAGELHFYDEEEKCFKKALQLAKSQNNDLSITISTQNLATNAVHQGNPDKTIHWAEKALKLEESAQSHIDLGFAYLSKKDYANGWVNYNYGIGVQDYREIKQYKDEPEWDGSPDKNIVLYADQGIGDQILFSSAVTDARRVSKKVFIHVNSKLKTLMERSHLVPTYAYGDDDWVDSVRVDASCSMSRTMQFFKNDSRKISGKPFLIADPMRRLQWRSLLDALGDKLNVGIAWTGGVHSTGVDSRSASLEMFLPLLKKNVNWVNLEYKDRTEEIQHLEKKHGIKVHDFSWALRTENYEDTAALVNELDLVISVPTSVVHLAGGLGTPCWCILQPTPHCFFGVEGEKMPFYDSVRLFRRKSGWDILTKVQEEFNEQCSKHSRNMLRSDPSRPWTFRDIHRSSELGTNGSFTQGMVQVHKRIDH